MPKTREKFFEFESRTVLPVSEVFRIKAQRSPTSAAAQNKAIAAHTRSTGYSLEGRHVSRDIE